MGGRIGDEHDDAFHALPPTKWVLIVLAEKKLGKNSHYFQSIFFRVPRKLFNLGLTLSKNTTLKPS